MTFTENFRTGIVGGGGGEKQIPPLRFAQGRNDKSERGGMTKQQQSRNGKRVRGYEEEEQ